FGLANENARCALNSHAQEASPRRPRRTDEDAASRGQPGDANANAPGHAQRPPHGGEAGKAERTGTGESAAHANRGGSRGDGANNATEIPAKAARRPAELNPAGSSIRLLRPWPG